MPNKPIPDAIPATFPTGIATALAALLILGCGSRWARDTDARIAELEARIEAVEAEAATVRAVVLALDAQHDSVAGLLYGRPGLDSVTNWDFEEMLEPGGQLDRALGRADKHTARTEAFVARLYDVGGPEPEPRRPWDPPQ